MRFFILMLILLSPRLDTTLASALAFAPLAAPKAEFGGYVAPAATFILYFLFFGDYQLFLALIF